MSSRRPGLALSTGLDTTLEAYLSVTTGTPRPEPVISALVASIYAPRAVLLQPGAIPVVGRQAIARTLDAGPWWCPSDRDVLIVVADGNRAMLATTWDGPRGNEITVAEIMSFDGPMIFQHRIIGDTSAVGRNAP